MDGQLEDTAVLVVEDDAALRTVVKRALSGQGCRVQAFGSGPEALQALSETSVDLLLADLALPDMDGLTLVARARELDPTLPVLVMTGGDTAMSAVAAADLGVDGYLRKPFTLKRLIGAARRAVGRRQLERRLRALEVERAASAARLEALRVIARSLPHELHQPLSCIMGYAALMAEEELPVDDMRGYAREIVQAAERLAELVRQLETAHTYVVKEVGPGNVLLDVSKVTTG